MKLSKSLVVPLAGLLLVGAAGVVLATSAAAPASDTASVVPAVESPSPSAAVGRKSPRDGAIADVLTRLVTKGTITAAQKTAILDALEADRTERQAARKAARELIKGFLADGVITKAELDQLPADHPLRQLTSLMDDGKITLDELRSTGRGFMKGFGGRGDRGGWMHDGIGGGPRGGMGGGMWGPNASVAPPASPATGS